MHAFTIDLEEWFCTHNFNVAVHYDEWSTLESRIQQQTDKILSILDRENVKATFFVLGWVAERFPHVIDKIAKEDHEIGSHGYSHKLTWEHSYTSFLKDLCKSTTVIEQITGQSPKAFRAPAFSIVENTKWATDALSKSGYLIDSSIYPISVHPEYGMADSPLMPFNHASGLTEIPMSCVEVLGKRIPMSGGAYFRMVPYQVYKRLVKELEKQGRKLNFYIHPWELDPDIPKIKGLSMTKRLRHYSGLKTVERKLIQLVNDFQFGPLTHAFEIPIIA